MSDKDTKFWVCEHCGGENSIDGALTSAHSKAEKEFLEAEVRAELSEEMASLERKVKTKDLEVESLKKLNDDQIQSKIDLALAEEISVLNAKFLLDKQALKNENLSLKQNIEKLSQKSAQGSVQAQGETGEILIEEMLAKAFPYDQIKEVKKGDRGADCVLTVFAGQVSSSILIESKVTKRFEGTKWLPKLRADMETQDATFGILVSDALPSDKSSAYADGNIWICGFHEFLGIVGALRQGLDRMNRLKLSRGAAESTAQEMLDFLTSPRFASIIESMLAPADELRTQLQKERAAFERQWRVRESSINKMFDSAAMFHGELVAIAGENIPEISALPTINNLLSEEK